MRETLGRVEPRLPVVEVVPLEDRLARGVIQDRMVARLTTIFGALALLLASLGLGSALPSTPGYVGIFQFVAVTVLLPFGFSRTDAIAYILVAQAMGYIVIGFWGALGLIRYRRAQRPT